jgi:uncharacterized membrane protein YkvA (DUF1232 family)
MAITLDRATLDRTIRRGIKKVKAADLGRVIRRSRTIRRLAAGPLGDMASDVMLLLNLVKAYARGEYKQLPRYSVFAATFALLYLLNPFDLIPDFIPGVGYVDDAAVLMIVVKSIRADLEGYRTWTQKLKRSIRHMSAAF